MEATWFYVAIALLAIVAAVLFRHLVGDKALRHRIASWVLILFGVAVLITAAFETGHDLFFVAAGLVFFIAGIFDLFVGPKQSTGVRPHS